MPAAPTELSATEPSPTDAPAVPLSRLVPEAAGTSGTRIRRAEVLVSSIAYDSREVRPGALFCCLTGQARDGHDFAAGAVAAGAVALLVERPVPLGVAQVVVPDARSAMARAAAALYGHPSRRLVVAGVTGTNGKTTVAYLLAAALEAGGVKTGVVGTLTQARTTPEAPELQARLAALAAGGAGAVAMEVSSEALAQHRADGTWFSVAIFTNLSSEHLNFHGSLEEYFAAKAALFAPDRTAVGVVNGDDPYGRRIAAIGAAAGLAVRAFSMSDATEVAIGPGGRGSTFRWAGQAVHVRLDGAHNLANALAAATAATELGVEPRAVAEGLGALSAVPGRFERIEAGQPFTVVVDFAHTPVALAAALAAARAIASGAGGRVVLVFGCGGDRDRAKRPEMGKAAASGADVVVVTSDNPRSEDPLAIIAAVEAGAVEAGAVEAGAVEAGAAGGGATVVVEPDRRAAMALALAGARPGDVVVIAGKGHEGTQVGPGGPVPFDDRAVARELLGELGR